MLSLFIAGSYPMCSGLPGHRVSLRHPSLFSLPERFLQHMLKSLYSNKQRPFPEGVSIVVRFFARVTATRRFLRA